MLRQRQSQPGTRDADRSIGKSGGRSQKIRFFGCCGSFPAPTVRARQKSQYSRQFLSVRSPMTMLPVLHAVMPLVPSPCHSRSPSTNAPLLPICLRPAPILCPPPGCRIITRRRHRHAHTSTSESPQRPSQPAKVAEIEKQSFGGAPGLPTSVKLYFSISCQNSVVEDRSALVPKALGSIPAAPRLQLFATVK